MTRNEFIAETAARLFSSGRYAMSAGVAAAADAAALANAVEAVGCAPWFDAAPALPDAARRVVEAAVEWNAAYEGDNGSMRTRVALSDAVRNYKESAK